MPPIKYLEAGARLFNSGNFELAAKYLDAAQMYRDQLQQDEQTTLDAYLKELSQVQASAARRIVHLRQRQQHQQPGCPGGREPAQWRGGGDDSGRPARGANRRCHLRRRGRAGHLG